MSNVHALEVTFTTGPIMGNPNFKHPYMERSNHKLQPPIIDTTPNTNLHKPLQVTSAYKWP